MNRKDTNHLKKKRSRSASEPGKIEEDPKNNFDDSICKPDRRDSRGKKKLFGTCKSPFRESNSNNILLNLSPITNNNNNNNNFSFFSQSGSLSPEAVSLSKSLAKKLITSTKSPKSKNHLKPIDDCVENCLKSIAFICEGKDQCVALAIWKNELYASANSFGHDIKENNKIKIGIEQVINYFKVGDTKSLGILPKMLLDNLIANSFWDRNLFYENPEEEKDLIKYLSQYFYKRDPQEFSKCMGISTILKDKKIMKRIRKFIFHYNFLKASNYCKEIVNLPMRLVYGSSGKLHAELRIIEYLLKNFQDDFKNRNYNLIVVPSKKLCFKCHTVIHTFLINKYNYMITVPENHYKLYGNSWSFPEFMTPEMRTDFLKLITDSESIIKANESKTINHSTLSITFNLRASAETIEMCQKFSNFISEKIKTASEEGTNLNSSQDCNIMNSDDR